MFLSILSSLVGIPHGPDALLEFKLLISSLISFGVVGLMRKLVHWGSVRYSVNDLVARGIVLARVEPIAAK